jgi:peroxiredoxin
MARLSDKQYLILTAIVFGLIIVFHIAFKKRLDQEDIDRLKEHFSSRNQYLGEYAPDFTLQCTDGTTFTLSDCLATNVVILNFFTTWCGPCKSEMDEFTYLRKSMEGKPAVFLAIDVGEDRMSVKQFLNENDINLPVGIDKDKIIAGKYRLEAFPTTVVISPQGRILLYEEGAIANVDVSIVPFVRNYIEMLEHKETGFSLDLYFEEKKETLPERLTSCNTVTNHQAQITVTNEASEQQEDK